MVARYACVALQRLNGSHKKVKGLFILLSFRYSTLIRLTSGSLADKTLRLEMESPVFKRLQEALTEREKHSAEYETFSSALDPTVLEKWSSMVEEFRRNPLTSKSPYHEEDKGFSV